MHDKSKKYTHDDDMRKFFKEGGDVGFSPERNKAIIDGTIREYEEMRKKALKKFDENLGEAIDATASYLTHVNNKGDISIEKYLGKTELARLRGEKIRDSVMISKLLSYEKK